MADASTLGIPPTKAVRPFVDAWETVSEGLLTSLTRREQERAESLASKLAARAEEDAAAVRDVLEEPEGCTNSSPPHSTSRVPIKVPMGELDGQRAEPS